MIAGDDPLLLAAGFSVPPTCPPGWRTITVNGLADTLAALAERPELILLPATEPATVRAIRASPLPAAAAPILAVGSTSLDGADLVLHSATKFLCGHGTAIGGLLVDGGTFDWQQAYEKTGHFAELCEPYEGFHGMVFTEESTVGAFALRARREGLRDFGAAMSPHNAFAILQGVETLSLRMQRHVENARKVAEFLVRSPAVESVAYPELETHPDHALAQRMMPNGCGAVFSFNLKGDRAAGKRFVDSLKVFSHLANVGDAKSLVIHPASTTHFRVPADQLQASGIAEGTMRLSVGLESPDDLLEDLAHALKAAQKGGA